VSGRLEDHGQRLRDESARTEVVGRTRVDERAFEQPDCLGLPSAGAADHRERAFGAGKTALVAKLCEGLDPVLEDRPCLVESDLRIREQFRPDAQAARASSSSGPSSPR
jgi:hypothetical protein